MTSIGECRSADQAANGLMEARIWLSACMLGLQQENALRPWGLWSDDDATGWVGVGERGKRTSQGLGGSTMLADVILG